MLAEVRREFKDAHAWIRALDLFQSHQRVVAAAVVHENDFRGLGYRHQDGTDRGMTLAHHGRTAVEDRNDDGDHELWRAGLGHGADA